MKAAYTITLERDMPNGLKACEVVTVSVEIDEDAIARHIAVQCIYNRGRKATCLDKMVRAKISKVSNHESRTGR